MIVAEPPEVEYRFGGAWCQGSHPLLPERPHARFVVIWKRAAGELCANEETRKYPVPAI